MGYLPWDGSLCWPTRYARARAFYARTERVAYTSPWPVLGNNERNETLTNKLSCSEIKIKCETGENLVMGVLYCLGGMGLDFTSE